jgi:hypothetical protein
MNVIGYLRVSTEEQARSGLGMDAQREAIEVAAKARGWHVTWAVDDGYSGSTLKRPARYGVGGAAHVRGRGAGQVAVFTALGLARHWMPSR